MPPAFNYISVTRLIAIIFVFALTWVGIANASHVCVSHACDDASVSTSDTGHDQSAKQDKAGDKLMCKFACHVQSLAVTAPAIQTSIQTSTAEQPDFTPGPLLVQLSASPDQPPRAA